jgi:hypothetical protein
MTAAEDESHRMKFEMLIGLKVSTGIHQWSGPESSTRVFAVECHAFVGNFTGNVRIFGAHENNLNSFE